jgi:hypothetical protein
MNNLLLLEEKHALLKNELSWNLQKKLALELRIGKQFEELKKLETTLEKNEHRTVTQKQWPHRLKARTGSLAY